MSKKGINTKNAPDTKKLTGGAVYDLLETYANNLEESVARTLKSAVHEDGVKELQKLRAEIELNLRDSEKIGFSLRTQESRMRGQIKGIDKKIRSLGRKPEEGFFVGDVDDAGLEDVDCPFCGYENIDFEYGLECRKCGKAIESPYKDHTICPHCNTLIYRQEIFSDKEGYELNSKTNKITCHNGECVKRFDWKKHRRQPKVFGLKICIGCNMPFFPDKRNYKRQLVCENCKEEGIDSFRLDNPDYQKRYRERMKKK